MAFGKSTWWDGERSSPRHTKGAITKNKTHRIESASNQVLERAFGRTSFSILVFVAFEQEGFCQCRT